MSEQVGTVVLITDPKADIYLKRARIKTNNPPQNRLSRQCGGVGGFDDYVERWHT
jgi:hypothetical protein